MTPDEIADIRSRRDTSARAKAIEGLQADPDAAAEAVRLEKTTGADSQMIYGSDGAFQNDYKQYLTERMLDRNPGLKAYIEAHPMSAKVSKDDWNRMADVYDKMDMYSSHLPGSRAMQGALKAASTSMVETFQAPLTGGLSQEDWEKYPDLAKMWTKFFSPIEMPLRMIGGTFHAMSAAVGGALKGAGVDDTTAHQIQREAENALTFGFMTPHGLHPTQLTTAGAAAYRITEAMNAAKPYLKAGERPPLGTHPVWDAIIGENAKETMSVYDALVDAAKKTETRALSPEMFKVAVEQKLKDQPLFLHWDAVRNLYGDKLPEPGDGLLGDIPGIREQFQTAIDTASDVRVPMAEWLSKVPDDVMKALHDDVRIRPDDPTLREVEQTVKPEEIAKEIDKPLPEQPAPEIEDPGVRMTKLRVEYAQALSERSPADPLVKALRAVSGYDWKPDEISKAVTWAELNGRPDIVNRALEMAELTDPEVHARLETEVANIRRHKDAQDVVKREMADRPMFSLDDWTTVDTSLTVPEFKSIDELIASGEWVRMGAHTVMKTTPEFLQARETIRATLDQLLQKLVGKGKPSLAVGEQIRYGEGTPGPAQGMYLSYQGLDPAIVISLNALDRASTLRHEVLHHLRTYGYFTKQEWSTLRDMVVREGLVKKHRLLEKGYDPAQPGKLIEEAIAHEWQSWAEGKFKPASTAIERIFQKIYDFFENARIALKELFGGRLTEEEIFQSIASGRIGQRGPGEPLFGAKDIREAAQRFEHEVPKIEAEGEVFKPGALLPKDRYARYMRMIDKKNEKDVKKLFDEARKEVQKRLEPEWKKNYAKQYQDSISDIKNRPDFRFSAFLRTGQIGDTKLGGLPKINPDFLSPVQKEGMPKRFLSEDGFTPDQLAGYFGYKAGTEMIDAFIRFEADKGKEQPAKYLERIARKEAERRMEAQFGKLDEDILAEAREHAIGLERFDLMHEETLALAAASGQEFPFSKQDIKDQAWLKFNDSINSHVGVIRYTRELAKSNRASEAAWLKGDALGAFVERQRSLRLQALAEHAKKFEREKARMERNLKRFSKREVDGVPPEFTNWIHDIMFKVERPPKRSVQDLQANIEATYAGDTLQKFAERYSGKEALPEGMESFEVDYNPGMPIWEELFSPNFRQHLDTMTVGQYRAVNASIQGIINAGRAELRGTLEGREFDRKERVGLMVEQLKNLGEAGLPAVGDASITKRIRGFAQYMRAGLLQMEFMWDRIDRGKTGLFTRQFTFEFAKAGSEYRTLNRFYARQIKELEKYVKGVDLKEQIAHDVFLEPLNGLPEEGKPAQLLGGGYLTRSALRGVLLNVGNKSNLDKLARGYHTTPERVMEWVNENATKEDWLWAQGIGKVFENIQNKADLMTMNLTGVLMERLPTGKIATNVAGELDGWYYPMIYDRTRGGGLPGGMIDPNPPPVMRLLTEHGFERKRTGYAGPVDLSLSNLQHQINRRIRDIAFREVLTEAGRFFKDKNFTNAMTKHMGESYTSLLVPYLRDIAGVRGPTDAAGQGFERFMNTAQSNIISTLIGWNPGTVFKHTPTAYLQSFKELRNPVNLLKATADLWRSDPTTMQSNRKFMMEGGKVGKLDWEGSGELQGRLQHWKETLGGSTDIVMGNLRLLSRTKSFAIEKSSWAIAQSDLFASQALWLAKYREVMQDLKDMKVEEAHTEAVNLADQAVRKTHGSTVITSRPAFMRKPMYSGLTALYGFFNHMFNRYYRMSWQTAELYKDLRRGEASWADAQNLATDAFFYIVAPAWIEEMVTPIFTKDEEKTALGYLTMPFKHPEMMLHPILGSIPLVREVAHAVYTGHDPAYAIVQPGYKAVTDFVRTVKKGKEADPGDVLLAANTLLGVASGLSTVQLGRWQKFMYNYAISHTERPKTPGDWYRAFRYGTIEERRH